MMLSVKIALRFLLYSKGQTLLIVLGIAIGVSVQIFIGLLIQGLQTSLIDKTIGSTPHITITSENNADIENYELVMNEISSNIEVKAIAATLTSPAFTVNGEENLSLLVKGATLNGAATIYKLDKALINGNLPINSNEVIVGKEFYEKGNYNLNDTITIFIPDIGNKELTISGVFDLKVASINKSWLISDILTAQNILNKANAISAIEIQIDDVFSSVGIILGLGLSLAFTNFALNPDGTPLIPLVINYKFIALSGLIAIIASMSAALIPAFRSMKMDPIEVIKNG